MSTLSDRARIVGSAARRAAAARMAEAHDLGINFDEMGTSERQQIARNERDATMKGAFHVQPFRDPNGRLRGNVVDDSLLAISPELEEGAFITKRRPFIDPSDAAAFAKDRELAEQERKHYGFAPQPGVSEDDEDPTTIAYWHKKKLEIDQRELEKQGRETMAAMAESTVKFAAENGWTAEDETEEGGNDEG